MKIRCKFPLLAGISVLAVILITSIASTRRASAVAPAKGPSARGAGEFSVFVEQRFKDFRYSFTVRANEGGHAHGFAEFDNLTDGTQVVVNVKCLQVNDSDAVMTGFVLHSDDPNFPIHSDVIFAAIDSDLNPQIGTDFITPIFVFPDVDCHSTASPLTLLRQPPEAIQVVP